MLIISDNSALSALAETDLLHVLPVIFGSVVITESVHGECRHRGAPEVLRTWIADPPDWLSIVPDPAVLLPETASLGSGEAASISLAWAHRRDSLLILDERRGRRVAQALGISITGVLAICAEAANRRLVDFEEALRRLVAVDFHLSESVVAEVRRRLK